MPGTPTAAAAAGGPAAAAYGAALSIDPDYFREDFGVDALLVRLTRDVVLPAATAGSAGGAAVGGGREASAAAFQQQQQFGGSSSSDERAAQATVERVVALQKRLGRAEDEIALLAHEVAAQLLDLQHVTSQNEQAYKAEARALERVAERIKDGMRDLDGRVSRVSQTAARIGDRLQTAEAVRVRCLEAQELICHLQTFSCHTAGQDFAKLPPIFTNDASLAEAAAVTRRLHHLASEVLAAKQRNKAVAAESPGLATPGNTGGIGSVEHTLKVLEGYCSWLENRVVSRFDAAVADDNPGVQAQVAAIMRELGKQRSIAQRWVASRPMFLAFAPQLLDDWLRRANREAAAAAEAAAAEDEDDPFGEPDDLVSRQARVLARLYREMHASAKDEFVAAQQVFPDDPSLPLEMFLSRLLEQNVQAVLERLLLPSSIGMATLAAAAAQQQQQQGAAAAAGGQQRPRLAALKGGGHSRHNSSGSFIERASNLATSFAATSGAAATAAAAAVAGAAGGNTGGAAAAAAGLDDNGGGTDALLGLDGSGPQSAGLQRQRLRLLAEAYGKTRRLAANLEKSVRSVAPALDVASMAEGLWPAFLGNYPEQELQWLAAAAAEEVAAHDSPELSMDVALQLLSWNREAIARASKLSAPGKAARNCRMLFHTLLPATAAGTAGVGGTAAGGALGGGAEAAAAGAADRAAAAREAQGGAPVGVAAGQGAVAHANRAAHPGCLLEQLARHILGGVQFSLELCSAGSSGLAGLSGGAGASSLFRLHGTGGAATRASAQAAASTFVNERLRNALKATHTSASVVTALQVYFSGVVVPAVSGSVGELSAASSALLALIRAVEDSITVVLRKCVDAFVGELERVLASEQRRSDFLPRDDAAVSFDRPTPACLLGTALLQALGVAASDALEGANLRLFLTEVSHRVTALLLAHMCRFTFSPSGALKWKKDVGEYADALAGFGGAAAAGAEEEMGHMQQLLNVLVVAPESLLGLVNGTLRMPHREALRYVALREDFKTARVEGRPLAALFSGEGLQLGPA